jgi:hypothetical protein
MLWGEFFDNKEDPFVDGIVPWTVAIIWLKKVVNILPTFMSCFAQYALYMAVSCPSQQHPRSCQKGLLNPVDFLGNNLVQRDCPVRSQLRQPPLLLPNSVGNFANLVNQSTNHFLWLCVSFGFSIVSLASSTVNGTVGFQSSLWLRQR